MWVDKGRELYNRLMKSWLQDNSIEIYSTHQERKSGVAERIIETFKNKIHNNSSYISKNVYDNKLDDTVNKKNNTYHSTIKVKPVDVKPSTNFDLNKENNREGTKFEVSDHVRI